MSNSASTIIIPVETQVREMDAKLLLACAAAERGFPVIIGSRAFVHYKVSSIPRGVYLAKSMRALSIRMFDILRKLGHEIVAWDEEGLLRWPDPEYYRQRLSPVTMGQISHLMAWGPDNDRVFREYGGYNGTPIHITGNPRIDLLRRELREFYQPEVQKIRDRFGDFMMINTNFGLVNHFYPDLGTLKKAVDKNNGSVHTYDVGKGHHKLALFKCFTEMLPLLCTALKDYTIVLRPHPSENQGPYLEAADRHKNLKVTGEGGISPWLMAAKGLIANGCTTMIEAAVLGTPTIAFQPVTSTEFDDDLPNSLAHRVYDNEELCSTAEAVLEGKMEAVDDAVRRRILDRHIAGLDGQLAAERMVDVLESGQYNKRQPPAASAWEFGSALIHNTLRTAVKQINMRRPGHRNNLAFHRHRFPNISVMEIEERIARLGRLLNRFKNIHVESYSKYLFRISRKEAIK
jgi:surface carbohydrate biosynthesis protein